MVWACSQPLLVLPQVLQPEENSFRAPSCQAVCHAMPAVTSWLASLSYELQSHLTGFLQLLGMWALPLVSGQSGSATTWRLTALHKLHTGF